MHKHHPDIGPDSDSEMAMRLNAAFELVKREGLLDRSCSYVDFGFKENSKAFCKRKMYMDDSLFGDDIKQIRSLLFCLDYYLDPYYKNTLPYEKEVYDSLQKLVISSRNDDVIDDCLQLIGDHCCYPLTIMEQGFENIKDSKKPDARYELNQP